MDSTNNLWTRRTNSSKLSLSTPASGNGPADASSSTASAGRNSFSKRFGGDTSAHASGKSNPFNSATTPGGSLMSPTGAFGFGLGSGAFASFGSAKTPKSPGNPFDAALKSAAAKTAAEEKAPAVPKIPAAAAVGAPLATPACHPTRYEWVFWFRPPISKANGYIEYEKTLHAMCSVSSVEEFFEVYAHLKRPSALPLVSDYHLFKKGVRPIWEDDENRKGGKWIIRLRKGVVDRYWEDLLLALVGDQFGDASEEMCGVVLSVRNGEDILSVWSAADGGRVLRIRETIRRVLGLPHDTKLDWKSHDSSLQQRAAIEESRREKGNNRGGLPKHHQTQQQPQPPPHADDYKQSGSFGSS